MSEQEMAAEAVEESHIGEEVESEEIEAAEEGAYEESEESSEESEGELEGEELEELQAETQEALDEAESEEEVQEIIKEYELKVNGKTFTKKFDPTDPDAVRAELQKAAMGQISAQEAAELKKMYTEELKGAKENPWEFMKQLGLDPDELTENYLQDKITEYQKPPEQREKEQIQRELAEAREAERVAKEALQSVEDQKRQQEQSALIESEMNEALSAHSNLSTLPDTSKTRMRIADAMLWAMDNGFEEVSVTDVLPIVEGEIKAELNEFLQDLPVELMEEYLGKQNAEKMRKQRLKNFKKKGSDKILPTTGSIKKKEAPKPKKSAKDWFREL